ncbi:hypothetical protein [uncultured Propionivibrio sp.]|uniref:hypothetical protein n=1 Tax=uncultured Propionivibrio sp. TaxID=426737 RepID=UPI0029BFBE40|nr:hypothetical protein [uncultured Propionivibrio sp.]
MSPPLEFEGKPLLSRLRLGIGNDIAEHLGNNDRLVDTLNHPGFETRQRQQLADEAIHPFRLSFQSLQAIL